MCHGNLLFMAGLMSAAAVCLVQAPSARIALCAPTSWATTLHIIAFTNLIDDPQAIGALASVEVTMA